jgi:uncharacterized protein (TIGR03435 family)
MTPRAVAAALVVTCVVTLDGRQDQRAATGQFPTTFEVVSIRPNTSGEQGSGTRRQPGGRFSSTNATILQLLRLAYSVQPFQIVNAPDWLSNERYDITAKLDGDPPPMPPGSPNDPMVLAVQAMLADRFKLAVHRETREMDIYALMLATPNGKPGPALRSTTQDCERLIREAAKSGTPPAPPQGAEVVCGIRTGFGRAAMGGSPLSMFASALSNPLGRVVVDRTGLTGGWDFELTFAPDASMGSLPPGVELPPVDPNTPNLFTAVREQLGLKLEPTRGPVEVLVIDNVDRPTPD